MNGAILLLFLGINAGHALQCYNCNSHTISDCKKGSPKLNVTICGLEHPDFKTFCILKNVYDHQLQKDNVLSGCEITSKTNEINKNIAQCQTDDRYEVRDCVVCNLELCNYVNNAVIVNSSLAYITIFIFFKEISLT